MREILHITTVSLRGISARSGESAVVAVGIACVVFVLVMTLGLASSLTDAIATTGHPDRAVVLRNGAVVESLSSLARADAVRLHSLPGVARQRDGDVAVSPEVLVNVMLDDVDGLVLVRGLTAAGFELRPEIPRRGRQDADTRQARAYRRATLHSGPCRLSPSAAM